MADPRLSHSISVEAAEAAYRRRIGGEKAILTDVEETDEPGVLTTEISVETWNMKKITAANIGDQAIMNEADKPSGRAAAGATGEVIGLCREVSSPRRRHRFSIGL